VYGPNLEDDFEFWISVQICMPCGAPHLMGPAATDIFHGPSVKSTLQLAFLSPTSLPPIDYSLSSPMSHFRSRESSYTLNPLFAIFFYRPIVSQEFHIITRHPLSYHPVVLVSGLIESDKPEQTCFDV
jgi:hypothetical protein